MTFLPSAARALLHDFRAAFTRPTFLRGSVFLFAAIVTTGRRTVPNLLRVAGDLAPGASLELPPRPLAPSLVFLAARPRARFLLDRFVPDGPVPLAGDDTVDEHRGAKVYGKGCHRDAVRSTHAYTAYRWGHKGVVLALLVKFPFASRPWALPVLVALYRPKEADRAEGRRHKMPPELMRQRLAALLRWFPERRFVFSGDGGYATRDLARFAPRPRHRLAVVSRFYPDANLYQPPPPRPGRRGRPPTRGPKLPSPRKVVAKAKRRRFTVGWYGGGTRRVECVSETGGWYRAGQGLVPIRWVFVKDLTGTHRDEYFLTTDVAMAPREIVGRYTGRWSLETTFQEMRAHLGLKTTRGRKKETVLRTAPCRFGLYSVVALLFASLPRSARSCAPVAWAGKRHVAFSDAVTAVRRWLWRRWIFDMAHPKRGLSQNPRTLRNLIFDAAAPAA